MRKNFAPLLTRPLPYYEELTLNLPPLLEVLEWSDRQQFDVIHVSTPGPMGLCGFLVAKMLRAPLVCTYHTDFPAYAQRLTRDHRVSNGTLAYMKWFYNHAAAVLSRSKAYRFKVSDLGVPEEKIIALAPAVDHAKFNPARRDEAIWKRLGVTQPLRVLYAGRISREKNVALLIDAFTKLSKRRQDVALVIAGSGPLLAEMKQRAAQTPVHFLGTQTDDDLAAISLAPKPTTTSPPFTPPRISSPSPRAPTPSARPSWKRKLAVCRPSSATKAGRKKSSTTAKRASSSPATIPPNGRKQLDRCLTMSLNGVKWPARPPPGPRAHRCKAPSSSSGPSISLPATPLWASRTP
jgi:hypothetical protein